MRGTRDRVVVEAQAEAEGQARDNCPLVARKPRGFVLADTERRWRGERDAFNRHVRYTVNFHREKRLPPVICGMLVTQANSKLVRTDKLPRR